MTKSRILAYIEDYTAAGERISNRNEKFDPRKNAR